MPYDRRLRFRLIPLAEREEKGEKEWKRNNKGEQKSSVFLQSNIFIRIFFMSTAGRTSNILSFSKEVVR